MSSRRPERFLFFLICLALPSAALQAQTKAQSPSASSKPAKPAPTGSSLEPGTVTSGIYRNKTLGLVCKIPAGWVLRTDEMNAAPEENPNENKEDQKERDHLENAGKNNPAPAPPPSASSAGAKVLLAAFSRPPEARAEDVNSSIVIAAENAASYPGLTDAAQYFGPLTEVAAAQGFTADEDPYAIAIGAKTLVRADFHKDVGSRVMRQSTLAILSRGYAVSITVIAGTEDEVEDLIDSLSFETRSK